MSFWRGKRVLITGHTGFKGAWLSLWLNRLGAEVHGYALAPPTSPSLFDLAGIGELVHHTQGDVRDAAALGAALRASGAEVVLHLAAQSLVRPSYEDPVATFEVNVMGTVNLLEAVRRADGVRAVVCVTSDKCYENRETDTPYREGDPMGGYDPYSASKGAAEIVVAAYRRSFFHPDRLSDHGLGLASARAGNVIGGGDWAKDRLVPDLMRAFSARERPVIRFPSAIRPWQHVLEPLGGYLALGEALWRGEGVAAGAWNFGPDDADARPVGWVADRIAALWGDGAGWDRSDGPEPHEAHVLKLDSGKARRELGWRPAWALEEGLRRTVDWHLAHAKGAAARDLTVAQIDAYGVSAEPSHPTAKVEPVHGS